ncbi:hypothetical protein [Streptomyces bungoensis]|uniref:hypothetical protein n=1 Tax=Streptomyces bungoensis TaxID=285568 RepID=UPI00342EDE9A
MNVLKGVALSGTKKIRVISRTLGVLGFLALLASSLFISPKVPDAGLMKANVDADSVAVSLLMLRAALVASLAGAVLLGWRERKIGIAALVLAAAISRYLSLAGYIY